MSTTDEVIGSIDHALRDFDTSDDAMRWMPEPAQPLLTAEAMERATAAVGQVMLKMTADISRFTEAVGKAMLRVAEFANAFAGMDGRHERDHLRRQALHTAYRARSRRRTRSRR